VIYILHHAKKKHKMSNCWLLEEDGKVILAAKYTTVSDIWENQGISMCLEASSFTFS